MENIQALNSQANSLQRELDKLTGMQQQLLQKKAEKLVTLDESTLYLDSSSEVLNALSEVHSLAQRESKELYENLLTTQLRELMPHNKECGRVVLNSYIRKSRPALSVEVETSSGNMRNVYEDKGGSIESVIAVGLRFICLSRTSNRRFLVFDEADQGLNARYMPQFASMLEQLATQIGVQVLYITHHPHEMLEGKGRVIELQSRKGRVETEILSDYKFEGETEGVNDSEAGDFFEDTGIEYLRIVNGKQHENTYIELCPHVNFIIGDNDIGKTSITQMIEAAAQNKGRDGLIRDGENDCAIEFGLEGEMTLEFKYHRTGAKKTSYKLFDSEGEVIQYSDSGTKKPEWLDEYLAMPLVNGIDLHISDQHNSSFILDKKYSEHQRAEILNIDDDAAITQKMITRHNEITDFHKKQSRNLKTEIGEIKSSLDKIRVIEVALEKLAKVRSSVESSIDSDKKAIELNSIIEGIERSNAAIGMLKKATSLELPTLNNVLPMVEIKQSATQLIEAQKRLGSLTRIKDLETPTVEGVLMLNGLTDIIDEITKVSASINTLQKVKTIQLPEITTPINSNEIAKYGANIAKSAKIVNRLSVITDIAVPNLAHLYEMSQIKQMGSMIVASTKKQQQFNYDIGAATSKLTQSQMDIQKALETMDYCPLCKTTKHSTQECA